MRYLFHFLWMCLAFVANVEAGVNFDPSDVKSLHVTVGTLEFAKPPAYGIIFRSGTTHTFYDFSADALLRSGGKSILPIKDLEQIGFRVDNGKEYDFDFKHESPNATKERAMKENPNIKSVSEIYQGIAGNRIEIFPEHPTPVARVDVEVLTYYQAFGGSYQHTTVDFTLWTELDDSTRKKEKP